MRSLALLAIGLTAAVVGFRSLVIRLTVSGTSMAPFLEPGATAIGIRLPLRFARRGWVVSGVTPAIELENGCAVEERRYIKFLVGRPGDDVSTKDGVPISLSAGEFWVEGAGEYGAGSSVFGPVASGWTNYVIIRSGWAEAAKLPLSLHSGDAGRAPLVDLDPSSVLSPSTDDRGEHG